ncbi:MAG TPA: hypothetical protein K8V15_02105 [Tessaracoccus flavescens]|uniref:Glucose-6-phosphate 1-epimerase n=1 Tax=Tessaracoccus flavescens TaxID=399497 RepID=A0A921END4_9ACTN|nr:hypothetical protein [Tessaracoccus flavescens]
MWQTHQLSGPWGSGAISELGGCVLSWAPEDHGELLFVSRDAELTEGDMWHGGIPVCAPWFGQGTGEWAVPHGHGLVSRVPWRTESLTLGDDAARVTLAVDGAATAHLPGADRYPADLTYRLDVEMGEALNITLTIESPSHAVVVDHALHPYLKVRAREATVSGLDGVTFVDYAADARANSEHEPVEVGRYLDRVYAAAPPTTLADDVISLSLAGSGTSSTVVWNPGPDGAVGDEWGQFACVEYGNVQDHAVRIPAGRRHSMTLRISPADADDN